MTRLLERRPMLAAAAVAAGAYGLVWLLYATPWLGGQVSWAAWSLLFVSIGGALSAMIHRGWAAVLPMLLLIAGVCALWFFTVVGLGCSREHVCF